MVAVVTIVVSQFHSGLASLTESSPSPLFQSLQGYSSVVIFIFHHRLRFTWIEG
jgi:hypothetical protein